MRDTVREAMATLAARPLRTLSQGLGVALGACAFVLAVGIGQTVAGQVDDRFTIAAATTVTVTPSAPDIAAGEGFITGERLRSVTSLTGAVGAARYATARDTAVSAAADQALLPGPTTKIDVLRIDPELIHLAGAQVRGNRLSDIDARYPRQVALVGRAAAARLGIAGPGAQLYVGQGVVTVVGVVDSAERVPQLLSAVILGPQSFDVVLPSARTDQAAIVVTRPGAAQAVATNLALQLSPSAPHALRVSAPPSPDRLRQNVSADVKALTSGAAAVVLVAGTFAIGNLILLSVMQRVPEIGMRRALGASRRQIVGQILAEAGLVGLTAGVLGAVLGVWVILGVCLWKQWVPTLGMGTVAIGVAAGMAGGVLGGVIPAVTAARVQPAEALRA
ncbi:MAG: ABC transporter permease [Micrococcales bacterium]|nr:ABC transporter permease [Micrococcales bacterium]